MKSAGKARSNGLYRHIRTSKEIIRNLLNDSANITMCETEIVSCRVLNISPTITALLRKVHCKVIFGVPEGIRQAAS